MNPSMSYNNGIITVFVSGGIAPYTYLWSNGATTQSISGLTVGTYKVTVTDSSSPKCEVTETIVLTATGGCNIGVTITQLAPTSDGLNNGSARANVTNALGPVTYLWSNGATTQYINNLSAGTYSVVVKEVNRPSCTATASINIGASTAACNISVVATCTPTNGGLSNGTASASVSGANGPITYLWSNGATTQSISGLSDGTYTVTVTETNRTSCNASDTCVIKASVGVCNITVRVTRTATTDGLNNGTATATVLDANGPVAYLWSNGATTPSISGLSSGTYNLTVSEVNRPSCTAMATFNIGGSMAACAIGVTVTGVTTTNGLNNGTATATVTGTNEPVTYLWSNGATTQTITNLAAGTYSVTVSEVNRPSCMASTSYAVPASLPPCNIRVTISGVATSNGLNNGSATANVTGAIGPVLYAWSNGANTQSINNLAAGIYTVTVREANRTGCTATVSFAVGSSIPACSIGVTVTGTGTSGGLNNGSATATVTNALGPVTYSWSNGATTQTINNLGAGTYTVIVTETNRTTCTASASYTVATSLAACTISVTTSGTGTSGGNNNGSATVSVTNALGAVSYAWSNGATTQTITNLSAGTYTVIVSEVNRPTCNATASYTVAASTAPCTISAVASGTATTGGLNNGTATVTVTGNNGSYTYLWSNGATTQAITGLPSGTYSVVVKEVNRPSCTATASINIGASSPNCSIGVTATGTATTNGLNNGSITANVSNALGPVTYSWSNGASTQSITNVGPGTYTVIVAEVNRPDCNASVSFTVDASQPPCNIAVSVTGTGTSGGLNNGSATANVVGALGAVSYIWSNGATTQTITNLPAGTYTVTVREVNRTSCMATASYTVATSLAACSIGVTVSGTGTSGGLNNGSATATVTGANGQVTYSWSNGATTQTISNLGAGTYTVTVSETNRPSCMASASYTVATSLAPCSIGVTATGTGTTGGLNNGSATANVTGANGPVSYLWSNGATTQTISNLAAGTYTVTVREVNRTGCTATASYTVAGSVVACAIGVTVAGTATTNGNNNGTATATVTGNNGPFTYLWSNGATTQSISNLAAGTYTVTVTETNRTSCQATASFYVVSSAPPCALIVTVTGSATTGGQNNGTATANVSNGFGPYSYSWSNGATTQSLSNLAPGTYTVTVVEVKSGCSVTGSYTVGGSTYIYCVGYAITNDSNSYGESYSYDDCVTLQSTGGISLGPGQTAHICAVANSVVYTTGLTIGGQEVCQQPNGGLS